MKNITTRDEALKIGGKEWGGKRVYFNDGAKEALLELEVSHYKHGGISSAKTDGKFISNSKANKMLANKYYFDIATSQIIED